VDAAVEAGADAIGFVLYPKSPRFVSCARARELARRLPPFVTPVLLFVNEAPQRSSAACGRACGDAAVPRRRDAAAVRDRPRPGRPWMRAARIPLDEAVPFDLVKFAPIHSHARAMLLDAHVEGYGGGGKAFDWSRLPPSVNAHLVLSGGFTPANVTDGIVQVRPRLPDAGR
jgi:phosphoribosylanthranilate isomerase